jgi:hypothetical protein
MKHPSLLAFALFFPLALPRPAAQQAADLMPVGSGASGISESEGRLWAVGPRYHAELGADGIVFTPALGRAAARTETWSAQPLSIGREQGPALALGAAEARLEGARAVLEHGGGVQALYDARADGLEQSFAIASRPAGAGDLVVAQRIATNWPLASVDAATGIEWSQPGQGGVHVGGVTAIDARGASVAGSLAFRDGLLEYRVPAQFVDAAAFPLLVDPLIGTQFGIGSDAGNSLDDHSPAAAYDVSTATYFVAWTRIYSTSSAHILGQRVDGVGAWIGAPILITTEGLADPEAGPAVGNCNAQNRFVVVHEHYVEVSPKNYVNGLEARSVASSNGALGPVLQLTGDSFEHPALASQILAGDSRLVLAYEALPFSSINRVEVRTLTVSATGALSSSAPVTAYSVASDAQTIRHVSISRSGGPLNRYLIAFETGFELVGDAYVRARAFDIGLAGLSSTFLVSETGQYAHRPSVDGDGTEFLVAWHTFKSGGISYVIRGRKLSVGGGVVLEPERLIGDDPNHSEFGVSVGFTGETYLAAWKRAGSFGTDPDSVALAALNRVTLEPCGSPAVLSSSTLDLSAPNVAARYAGGSGSDNALVAFTRVTPATGNGDIYGQLFETENGTEAQLGGGCGLLSGTARVGCAVSVADSTTLSLRGGIAGIPAFLFLSLNPLGWSEGGCTLHADPFSGFLIAAGNTTAAGEKDYALPLIPSPTLIGLQFHSQWGTYLGALGAFSFGGVPTGLNLSSAVRATFQ